MMWSHKNKGVGNQTSHYYLPKGETPLRKSPTRQKDLILLTFDEINNSNDIFIRDTSRQEM